MYDQLLQFIQESNSQCKILMSNSCPRGDTSSSYVNDTIQALAEYHGAIFIDQYKAFHDRHGNIIQRYYDTGCIQLSSSGMKRLLSTINREVTIVNDFARSFLTGLRLGKPHNSRNNTSKNNPVLVAGEIFRKYIETRTM